MFLVEPSAKACWQKKLLQQERDTLVRLRFGLLSDRTVAILAHRDKWV